MTHLTVGGHLKIYLGYAPGVGKTYQMLEDARELKARGTDLVIGFVESHGRNDIRDRLDGLETIPLRRIIHRGGTAEELDFDAVLRRNPRVCVVDELAHSNAPGSERQKRWQDVQALLQAGINVLTTPNVQDLASLSDQIWQLTGLRVRETVPDWLFQQADEVVIVDVTPRALVLEYLMMNARRAVTREMIMENVWKLPYDGSTNLIDVYVKYVRDKIDTEFLPKLVRTIRGVGYVVADK